MGTRKASRNHVISRASAERVLEGLGIEEDARFGLLELADIFGNVTLPTYEMTEDHWTWWSLKVSRVHGKDEWIIVVEEHWAY